MFTSQRYLTIAGSVVLLHVAVLWALQAGLIQRAVEIIVPVEAISELVAPAPKPQPPPPAPRVAPRPPAPVKQAAPPPERPAPPAPQPVAAAPSPSPTPSPNAPTGQASPQAPAAPVAAPVAAAPVAAAPATAPARVDLPSSDADYLQNPKPAYPPVSKRLGEQGKVVVRVFIGADGVAQRAEIRQSSGFDRLDQAALATVLKWRYVPGKRGGAPEAMWFNVPINFVLE